MFKGKFAEKKKLTLVLRMFAWWFWCMKMLRKMPTRNGPNLQYGLV